LRTFERQEEYKKVAGDGLFTFSFQEIPLYGRVNKKGEPVLLLEENLKQIGDAFLIDFVAAAFSDLTKYMTQAVLQRAIPNNSLFVNLAPKKSWEATEGMYRDYVEGLYKVFVLTWKGLSKIVTFKDFANEFSKFLGEIPGVVFSRSSFVLSNLCPIYSSGLVVDFGEFTDDSVEKMKYYKDQNIDFFAKAARKFGFRLDKDAPFRLVAYLPSVVMKGYMAKFGIFSIDALFSTYYKKTFETDLEYTKYYFYQMYRAFYSKYPSFGVVATCGGRTRTSITKRSFPTGKKAAVDAMGDFFWRGVLTKAGGGV
jgi:hypothetical protein